MVDAKTKLKKNPSARYLYFKIPGRTGPLYIHHDNNKVQTRASWGEGIRRAVVGKRSCNGSNMVRLTFSFSFLE